MDWWYTYAEAYLGSRSAERFGRRMSMNVGCVGNSGVGTMILPDE